MLANHGSFDRVFRVDETFGQGGKLWPAEFPFGIELVDKAGATLRVIRRGDSVGGSVNLPSYLSPGRSALTTWIKHGAAAICAATMACILSFDRARDRFVHLELIIVRQFFARADVA